MFLQDFQEVDRPWEEVVARLTADTDALLAGALDTARSEDEQLRARVGPPGWPAMLAKTVAIHPGSVRSYGDTVLLAFSWEATTGTSLFPRLDADLEVAPMGPGRTQLALRARYEPPGGALGRGVDQLLLHRLAESTIRAFLLRICAGLTGEVAEVD